MAYEQHQIKTASSASVAFIVPRMNKGGVESSVLRIGRNLKKLGHSVTVITTIERGEWFDRILESGLDPLHVGNAELSSLGSHIERVARIINNGKYDVVFPTHDIVAQSAIPLIGQAVGVVPMLRNDTRQVYSLGLFNERFCNAFVGNSPRIIHRATELVDSRRVRLIPNGVAVPPHGVSGERGPVGSVVAIAFVGRVIDESKGVFLIPEVLRHLHQRRVRYELTVIGDGPDLNELKKRILSVGAGDSTRFVGKLPHDEVQKELRRNHVLLLPSRYEGLPNVVLEALSNGCVPVANLLPSCTDFLIRNGETGFVVEKNDAFCMAYSICQIARDQALFDRLSSSGVQSVREKFSEQIEAQAYQTLIRECMAGALASPSVRNSEVIRSPEERELVEGYLTPPTYRSWLRVFKPIRRVQKRAAKLIGSLVGELIANDFIAKIPFIRMRMWFYQHLLNIDVGRNVNIQRGCYIYHSDGKFKIGDGSIVNCGCILDRRGGLTIGRCVSISPEAAIFTAGHHIRSGDFAGFTKPVQIGDFAVVGTRAMVMPGVTIGRGAVLLPGAVVTKDVGDCEIVGGVPARSVGMRSTCLTYDPSWFPWFR